MTLFHVGSTCGTLKKEAEVTPKSFLSNFWGAVHLGGLFPCIYTPVHSPFAGPASSAKRPEGASL